MADTATTEQFEVRNRWTNRVQFTATITCAPDASVSVKRGLAVRWGYRSGTDLSGAYLRGADLSGAYLRGADLSDAPKIENIHQTVYAAVTATPDKFDMGIWHGDDNFVHACDTTHCRAGWVVALAGEQGRELESRLGTSAAATLIYLASDPGIERIPNFYCGKADALADMKALAEREAA